MIITADVRLIQIKSLIAEARVTIRTELGDLNIKKVNVIEGKEGPFVTFPQESYTKKGSNEKKYVSLVYCSEDFKAKIDEVVFTALSEALNKKAAPAAV